MPSRTSLRFVVLGPLMAAGCQAVAGCNQTATDGGLAAGGTLTDTGGNPGAGSGSGGLGTASGGVGGSLATGGQGSANTSGAGGGDTSGAGGGESTGGAGTGGESGQSASLCEANALLLCDGFESGVIDPARWSVHTGGSTDLVEVTTSQAARGTHSVHISTKNGFGFLRNESAFPVPNNDYFGRMFVRVAEFSNVDWAHWTIAEAAGTGDGSLIRVGGQYHTGQMVNRWGVGSDGGPTGDWTIHDADPPGAVEEPPTNEWVCVEWEHKGSTNETSFFVDGEPHPSLHTTASDHGGSGGDYILPQMQSLWFGWYQYQDDDSLTFEVWIDELAIHTARIGCD